MPKHVPGDDIGHLVGLNAQLHERIERSWLNAMVSTTLVDMGSAQSAWMTLERLLREHAALEDTLVVPVFSTLDEFPRGATPDIVTNEHRKLAVHIAEGFAALSDIEAAMSGGASQMDTRKTMVLALPRLQRVYGLLEHHTLREQDLMYPAINKNASAAEVTAIAEALQAQIDSWS